MYIKGRKYRKKEADYTKNKFLFCEIYGEREKNMRKRCIRLAPAAIAATAGLCLAAAMLSGGSTVQAAELPDSVIIQAQEGTIRSAGAGENTDGPDGNAVGGNFQAGDSIVYEDIDFDKAWNTCLVEIAASAESDGKTVELHLDSGDGTLIGTVEIDATGDMTLFGDHYAELESVEGTHDLCLVFPQDTEANLDFFSLSAYNGEETEEEKADRLQWFRDAKFGQFIHFGAYSYAEGEYEGRRPNGGAEWIMKLLQIPKADYAEDIAKNFNPKEFDAQEYVDLAKETGQKYLVFTTRHHEGFSMFETEINEFKDYQLSTYGDYDGEDPVKALSDACHEAGIAFGTYYSLPDWHDKSQDNYDSVMHEEMKADYIQRLKGQIRELIEKYDPDILWFDGNWMSWWTDEDAVSMYEYTRTLKPSIITNNRVGTKSIMRGDYGTPEQSIPATGFDYAWESCMTLNGTWGYKYYDTNWKSADTVITNLVDIASKGGNYLLNIGPDADGNIPEATTEIFKEVGQWTSIYGDSIYGASNTCYEELPSNVKATTKEGKVYLHLLDYKGGTLLTLPKLKNEIQSVKVMGTDTKVEYDLLKAQMVLHLPDIEGSEYDTVIEMDVTGVPEAEGSIYPNIAAEASDVIADNIYNSSYSGWKAIDGDASTRWATKNGTSEETLTLVFDEPVTVNQSVMTVYGGTNNSITKYRIEYLDEDGVWQNAYVSDTLNKQTSTTKVEAVFDEAVTSTQIRLHILEAQNPSVWEFELYNKENYEIAITAPGASQIVSEVPFTVSGTADGGEKVKLTVRGDGFEPREYETEVAEDGTWSCQISLEEGWVLGTVDAALIDADGETVAVTDCTPHVRNLGPNLVSAAQMNRSSAYVGSQSYDAGRAADSDLSTRWAPLDNDAAPWLEADFGAEKTFDTVILSEWMDGSAYRCTGYNIQYSLDGNDWSTFCEGTSIGEESIITGDAVSARYVRVNLTGSAKAAPASLYEFEVYAAEADQEPEEDVSIEGLDSLYGFNEGAVSYPKAGREDLAKGKTVIVSSEHNANLTWNKITDGNAYASGSGTDTSRWAPRGYGQNDLLEGYGSDRQAKGDTHMWEFAAVDLGEVMTLDEIDIYFAELPGSYRVYLWDGENPVNPDGTAFTGEINGTYTEKLNITSNTATARYKDTFFHQFLPESFRITEEQTAAGKTFENAEGFRLIREFSYELTSTANTQKADVIQLAEPVEARYIIYEQTGTHNSLGVFAGSIRGLAAYAPQSGDAISVVSPAGNSNKLLDLEEDGTFTIYGTYSSEKKGSLDLEVTAEGPDFYSGESTEVTADVSDIQFSDDGTWTAKVHAVKIYGNMTLNTFLMRDGESVAEASVSNLIYRRAYNLARSEGAKPITVGSHPSYPASRLTDGVFAPQDNNTRWSVTTSDKVDGESAANVWLGVDLGADKTFDRIVLTEWQSRTSGFVIEYAKDGEIEDPDNNLTLNAEGWTTVKTGSTIGTEKVIDFSEAVTARYVRVRTTEYSSVQPGFTEIEVYKADNPVIDADALGAPKLPDGDSGVVNLPEIGNGTVKLYGSDNKQIIDMKGNFYRPLVDMSVNVMYEAEITESGRVSYSEKDTTVKVPGRYEDSGVNPAPQVVPAIREWYGSETGGDFILKDGAKIAVSGGAPAISAAVKTKSFFADMLGFTLVDDTAAGEGGIEMIYDNSLLAELGEEGYYLTIDDKITIRAGSETGLMYGGVTAAQIFYASDDNRTAPRGEARDYPKYEVRGGMIDVGRTYFPLDYLEEVGRYMAWYKLNTLQVHLSDGWDNTGYAAFRLECDTYPLIKYSGNAGSPGGENEGYYTKDEYRQFQKNLLQYGVEVINEIDTPAHSMIFGRLTEEEGRPPMRTAAHMNVDTEENRAEVEEFVLNLIEEYTTGSDPVFINGTVSFGGDEYSGSADALAEYSMDMIEKLRERGLNVRMWSSGSTLSSCVDTELIRDPNVLINIWHPAELASGGGVKAAYERGYNVINTCNFLYIDPANYNGYPDRYGGVYYQDSANPSDYTFEHIYDVFNVNNTYTPRRGNAGSALMPLAHPQTKGAQFVLWNDIASYNGGLSEFDLFDRFREGVMMASEKTWYGEQTEGQTWETFEERIDKQWDRAAGTNPARFVESIGDIVAQYDFNDTDNTLADGSGNGYDAEVTGAYEEDASGIRLTGEDTGISLPFDSIGFPYSVNIKAKLVDVPENTILFDGEDGTLYANFNGTGNLGYVRGEYGLEYHFEYKDLTTTIVGTETQPITLAEPLVEDVPENLIKADEWFDLTLVTEQTYPVHSNTSTQFRGVQSWTNVALYVNGERIVGRAANVWINNGKKFINSGSVGKRSNTQYDSTSFVLPTETILPQDGAVVNSLSIYNRNLTEDEVKALYEKNVLVEFESNGGSVVKSLQPGIGQTFSAPETPVREGYNFAGWYKDQELSRQWDFATDTVSGDTILYAKWEEEEEPSEPVSKKTLEYFLNQAKGFVEDGTVSGLVESVQQLFTDAIVKGEAVMADEDATREEMLDAAKDLMLAIHALNMKAADKTDLEMALELTELIDLSKYVETGQAEYLAAEEAAEAVMADGDAMQAETDAAWSRLAEAMNALRLKADKSVLQDLISQMEDLDLSGYTEASVTVFRAALASVNSIFIDETLSVNEQAKVDEAVNALQAAYDGLAKAQGGGTETPGGDTDDPQNPGGSDTDDPQTPGGSDSDNPQNAGGDSQNGDSQSGKHQTAGEKDSAQDGGAVQTGDYAPIAPAVLLLVLSAGAILIAARKRVGR